MNWKFEAGNVLNFFLILGDFEARCSYKIVLIKKGMCIPWAPNYILQKTPKNT